MPACAGMSGVSASAQPNDEIPEPAARAAGFSFQEHMMPRKPPAPMRKLTDEQKIYAVKRLAAYDRPAAIAHDLKEAFGVTISPQAIEHYDPERPAGHDLAPRWCAAFHAAREAHLALTATLGHLPKALRLHLRGRMAIAAWDEGNYKLANEILDAIAKEAGDVLNGKHGLFGPGGIQPTAIVTFTGPAEPEPEPEPEGEPAPAAADGVRKPRD
jgi:hypothetical protein